MNLKELSKQTVRKPTAKVKVYWSGKDIDNVVVDFVNVENRGSLTEQVITGRGCEKKWAFVATSNPIDSYARMGDGICVSPSKGRENGLLVGWWGDGNNITNENKEFETPQILRLRFPPMPIGCVRLYGQKEYGEYPKEFDVRLNDVIIASVKENDDLKWRYELSEVLSGVESVEFRIYKWNKRGAFVKVTAAFDDLIREHKTDDIMSMNVLEETDGSVGTLPVGNVSANELDLSLCNIRDTYFYGNTNSPFASPRCNRRIEPFFGFVDKDGTEILEPKGVYWSREWNIADNATTANTSALDRLGLLQSIQWENESKTWINKNLYEITSDILTDLRREEMEDLEFDIDTGLQNFYIPIAFFQKQSWFDVLKTIAEASVSFVYMDTPTEKELEQAVERGNEECNDILRIKKLEHFTDLETETESERLTTDDIINKTLLIKKEHLTNSVSVPYQEYEIKDGKVDKKEDTETEYITLENSESVFEYGKIHLDVKDNNLIQHFDHAVQISMAILKSFSNSPIMSDISTFGDVTMKVGDVLEIPEYQKNNVDTRGLYAITRISTEFDGGIRQSLQTRKLQSIEVKNEIEEVGDAVQEIDENGVNTENLMEG